MPVDVEVSDVPVQLLADVICQPAHGQDIAAAIERNAIAKAQPLPGQDLLCDWPKEGSSVWKECRGLAEIDSRLME